MNDPCNREFATHKDLSRFTRATLDIRDQGVPRPEEGWGATPSARHSSSKGRRAHSPHAPPLAQRRRRSAHVGRCSRDRPGQ